MEATGPRPLRTLVKDLVLSSILAVALYLLFAVFNHRFLSAFNRPEVLLLEAGAVVLVAYLIARSFAHAATVLLEHQGQVRHESAARIFINLIVAIGAALALFTLGGVPVESIFLGSAFAGIVLGLAAQTVLSNVFAGLLIVMAAPFHPGDRIGLVSSSYGALAPSYPHELMYPTYWGTVTDVGLLYTVVRLDSGSHARIPNSIVLTALIVAADADMRRGQRVRLTLPWTVRPERVEAALREAQAAGSFSNALASAPRLEVGDISPTTWDAIVVVATREPDESLVRDRVLREILNRLSGTGAPAPETARGKA